LEAALGEGMGDILLSRLLNDGMAEVWKKEEEACLENVTGFSHVLLLYYLPRHASARTQNEIGAVDP